MGCQVRLPSSAAAATLAVAAVLAVPTLRAATDKVPVPERLALLRRAQVWRATDVAAMDVRTGPRVKGAFAPNELVTCDYRDKKMSGRTPKFTCALNGNDGKDGKDGKDSKDEIKVKFGADNGEVYAEVAATRLLWALGFGADADYPVRVVCRKCPKVLGGDPYGDGSQRLFDPATIERKMPGREITSSGHEGWTWSELMFEVNEDIGGAPKMHRDALALLAAMMQHTDSKDEQQRLLCLPEAKGESDDRACTQPFLMVHDVGMTFGSSTSFNVGDLGSANYERWSKTKVWKGDSGCVANMPKSATGTLTDPPIGEAGRAFLAKLLDQLTDRQLQDLFEVARFNRRPRDPGLQDKPTAPASIDEWVAAFKQKRAEIARRTCGQA